MSIEYIIGNALEVLPTMEPESIDVCVTSPPYWNLRDYGSEPADYGDWVGQLGLEPAPDMYINHLVAIFDEVKRVLKPTGACWVNLGDTYLPNKSLAQIPSRFALEMANRGWLLRNEVIWHKINIMPTPVKDRFTVDFEKFFFFVKDPSYWFEQQREPLSEASLLRVRYGLTSDKGNIGAKGGGVSVFHMGDRFAPPEGRNKRCVWTMAASNSKDAHCAMFPTALIETPIKACCPGGGVVMDPFCGSGTVLEYCRSQNINAVGIKINPAFEPIIRKRGCIGAKVLDDFYTAGAER